MNRSISVGVCDQKFGDCGIYSITNAFMREIVLLLGWRGITDTEINWIEANSDNCSKYLQGGRDPNLYKYCILYTFVQRLLRKYFGSCGIQTQKVMSSFCDEFNSIIENLHELNKTQILTDLNAKTIKMDMEQLVAQYQVYITQLRSQNQINDKQMLADCLRRLNELTYIFNREYISGLEFIFTDIKVALNGNIFTAKSAILTPYPQGEDPFGPDDTETVREYTFQKGKYGVISVSYDDFFSSKFLNFKLDEGQNANLVNEILGIVQELDMLYDLSISEELPILKTKADKKQRNQQRDKQRDKQQRQQEELRLNIDLNKKMEEYFNTQVLSGSSITTIRTNIDTNLRTTIARNLDKHHAMTVKYMFSFTYITDTSRKTMICIVCKNTWGTGNAFRGLNILILETIPKAIFRYFEIIPKMQARQEMALSDDIIDASAVSDKGVKKHSRDEGTEPEADSEADAEAEAEQNIEPIIRRPTKLLKYIPEDENEEVASSDQCLQLDITKFEGNFIDLLSQSKLSQEEKDQLLYVISRSQAREEVRRGGQRVKLTKRRRKYKRQTYKKCKLSKHRRTYKRKIYNSRRHK